MTDKMVIICNGNTSDSIMSTVILGSSGLAVDYDVYILFFPSGAKWLLKGELEKLGTPKGMPNPIELFNTILELGGHVTLCELSLPNKDIDPKDLRDPRITIGGAPQFLMKTEGAAQTYVF